MLILTHQQQTAFENIVGKEEIARNEQFLLFPQCFLLNQIIVSPFVNIFDIIFLFGAKFEKPKSDISGKGLSGQNVVENAGNHSVLLFLRNVFSIFLVHFRLFEPDFNLPTANSLEIGQVYDFVVWKGLSLNIVYPYNLHIDILT